MNLNSWIKKQVKKKRFSKEPNPLVPFALGIIILLLTIYIRGFNRILDIFMIIFVSFTFVFALLHFYVWIVTRKY